MLEKKVSFKKAVMNGKDFVRYEEMTGTVIDKYVDYKKVDSQWQQVQYYLIKDDEGVIHQVRPYSILKVLD